jgi:hypothetical protein
MNEVREIREAQELGDPDFEFEVPKNTMQYPAMEQSGEDRWEVDVPARLLDALPVDLDYNKGVTMQFRNIPGSTVWKLRLFLR